MRQLYISERDGKRRGTEVTYHYDVTYTIPKALRGPLAKRLLKQVDKRVMNSALKDLKKRVESVR